MKNLILALLALAMFTACTPHSSKTYVEDIENNGLSGLNGLGNSNSIDIDEIDKPNFTVLMKIQDPKVYRKYLKDLGFCPEDAVFEVDPCPYKDSPMYVEFHNLQFDKKSQYRFSATLLFGPATDTTSDRAHLDKNAFLANKKTFYKLKNSDFWRSRFKYEKDIDIFMLKDLDKKNPQLFLIYAGESIAYGDIQR